MAKKSFGTLMKAGGSSGTAVAELYSVTPPSLSIDHIETTNHNQADIYRTFISTIADWGEVECEMGTTAPNINTFIGVIGNDAETWWISLKGAGAAGADVTMTFTGCLASFTPSKEATIDGKYVAAAKIKVSGNVTFAGLS